MAFRPEHLRELCPKDAQRDEYEAVMRLAQSFDDNAFGDARTFFIDDRPVVCAGVLTPWPGRGICWAILSSMTMREMVHVHHAVTAFLDAQPHRRLETSVRADFLAGHAWAEKCGFRPEGLMQSYGPDGSDFVMYGRIRHP